MKVVHSKYSAVTGDELALLDEQIQQAQKEYQRYVDEYNWGMQYGSPSYAERVRWDRVVAAEQIWNNLKQQREALYSTLSREQSINIIDETVTQAATETKQEIPWKTVGLAVGAIILIVIVVKLL